MSEVHGNYVAPDATKPSQLLGYVDTNLRGYSLASIQLPSASRARGTVDSFKISGNPPVWVEPGTSDCMLSWTYEETMSTGSSAVNLTEVLKCVNPKTHESSPLWSQSSSPKQGAIPAANFGAERAVDVDSGVLFTQSKNQSVGRYDLHSKKQLARLEKTAGKQFMCLHYDAAEKRLGAIVQAKSSPSDWQLVSIDTDSGAVTTRLNISDFPMACTRLSLFYLDQSSAPGDIFSAVSRPACSFSEEDGTLAFLLVAHDLSVKPAFANTAMYAHYELDEVYSLSLSPLRCVHLQTCIRAVSAYLYPRSKHLSCCTTTTTTFCFAGSCPQCPRGRQHNRVRH
jgi:hypothetical protein